MRLVSRFAYNINPFRLFSTREIIQSTNFRESVAELFERRSKSVAIFDVDHTLIITTGFNAKEISQRKPGFGGEAWLANTIKQLSTLKNFKKLYMLLLSEYFIAQHYALHATTDDCVPHVLSKLGKEGIPMIGLTARSARLSEITTNNLRKLGILFSGHSDIPLVLKKKKKNFKEDLIYHNGIIWCGGRSKKHCLEVFYKTLLGKKFFLGVEQVLYMDDSRKHCEDVYQFLIENRFDPLVIHYTHVMEKLTARSKKEMKLDAKKLEEKIGVTFRFK